MVEERYDRLELRTDDGVTFSLALASPVSRLLAVTVDNVIIYFVWILLAYGVIFLLSWTGSLLLLDLAWAIVILAGFMLSQFYFIVSEWMCQGTTPGKKLVGLQVLDAQGLRLTLPQVITRNLLRGIDAFPSLYLIGGITALLTPRTQRLGDLVAGTIVVRRDAVELPSLPPLPEGEVNSLAAYPHLEATLRQRTRPAEFRLALEAILRRDQLDSEPRLEVFRDLAERFRAKAKFPPEAIESLPDERFVLNCLESIERPNRQVRARRAQRNRAA